MGSAMLFGLRAALAAGLVVAAGSLMSESLATRTPGPFSLPAFGVTTATLSVGSFLWTLMIASGSAWILRGIENVPKALAYGMGIAFALLTPVLLYLLRNVHFSIMVPVLIGWVVAFPAFATAMLWYVSRPNISLQADRER
jgi:hypothetical protein